MAHKRPTVSKVRNLVSPPPELGTRTRLTPAQAHAERRSAPLTPTQFKAIRELAELGISPLRHR